MRRRNFLLLLLLLFYSGLLFEFVLVQTINCAVWEEIKKEMKKPYLKSLGGKHSFFFHFDFIDETSASSML